MNKERAVPLDDGRVLRLTLPNPCPRESYFIFGVYKGGSTLLNNIFTRINSALGIPQIGIVQQATEQGIRFKHYEHKPELVQIIEPVGYCYNSFRRFLKFLTPVFATPRKSILLVRDPRDIITSAYFSESISHVAMPGEIGSWQLKQRNEVKQQSIDSYALERAPGILKLLETYKTVLTNPGTKLFRYEDVVFHKQQWIEDMLRYLEFEIAPEKVAYFARLFDHRPDKEDPTSHIRKVTPGDHREKLAQKTISALNEMFGDTMEMLGYSMER